MAKYFSRFPKTFYQLTSYTDLESVTKITSGFAIETALKNNASVYYPYVIKDGETPELLAHRFYGSTEKHWIILSMNNMLDPFYDWPLDYRTFLKYIEEKYSGNAGANQTGISWAQNTVYNYYKVETLTYNGVKKSVQKTSIDVTQYNSMLTSSVSTLTLSDGTNVVREITKSSISYYDYEEQKNEAKRTIKILRPEMATVLDDEMKNIFAA